MKGNRERVLAALRFESGAGVPYEIGFNKGALEKMVRRTGDRDFARHTGSHLGILSLSAPETQFRPGFFRDEYGVVWNRSGADRDVGNIEGQVVGSLEELENYRPPAVDRAKATLCDTVEEPTPPLPPTKATVRPSGSAFGSE